MEILLSAGAIASVVVEILKRIPKIGEITADKTKSIALVVALILVGIPAYLTKELTVANASQLAISTGVVLGVSVGFYETVIKYIKNRW